ncbi:hypothetical protein OH687_11375 [Burkholderia anthina]|nr:hypothetical protein OH687_11375 [Burkholderia anthina]
MQFADRIPTTLTTKNRHTTIDHTPPNPVSATNAIQPQQPNKKHRTRITWSASCAPAGILSLTPAFTRSLTRALQTTAHHAGFAWQSLSEQAFTNAL